MDPSSDDKATRPMCISEQTSYPLSLIGRFLLLPVLSISSVGIRLVVVVASLQANCGRFGRDQMYFRNLQTQFLYCDFNGTWIIKKKSSPGLQLC